MEDEPNPRCAPPTPDAHPQPQMRTPNSDAHPPLQPRMIPSEPHPYKCAPTPGGALWPPPLARLGGTPLHGWVVRLRGWERNDGMLGKQQRGVKTRNRHPQKIVKISRVN